MGDNGIHTLAKVINLEQGRVQLLGQFVEGLGIVAEVPNLKHGLGGREVVLLQIVVQASVRASEVRNPCS